MSRYLNIIVALVMITHGAAIGQTRIAFWNLENYMDPQNDSATLDDDFTPQGSMHWTTNKLYTKSDGIAKTIIAMQAPAIIGLAEVENRTVLNILCRKTPLRNLRYSIIHHDSPDTRGIDCAIIYQNDKAKLIEEHAISMSDSSRGYNTRDVLAACFCLGNGDTLYLLVNHWPSKLGGGRAKRETLRIADTVFGMMHEVHTKHPAYKIIAMGDLNATYSDIEVAANRHGISNLMDTVSCHRGSYNYHGSWQLIDNMVGCGCQGIHGDIYEGDHLLEEDKAHLDSKPKRTHKGKKYNRGISDHLPIYAVIGE